jgi:hypothetical protein
MTHEISRRNIAGLADPRRANLYPVDFDALIERHELLGKSREDLIAALPALRGMSPRPRFEERSASRKAGLAVGREEPASFARDYDNQL